MEDEVHFSAGAVLVGDGLLSVLEDGGLQFHRAGFVGAVDVAEGGGEEEAADRLECFVDVDHVFGGRVKFLSGEAGGIVTVFFTTNAAGFDFEDDVEFGTFLEEFFGDGEVFGEFDDGAVEHVALEEGAFAFGDALAGGFEKRLEEALDFLRVAVVGVESDEDVVFLGENVDGFGQNDGPECGVVDIETGSELAATGGNLDDPVGIGIGEGLQGAVGGGDGSDVDGRVGVSAFLGGIEHGTVLCWCGDWHSAGGLADGGGDDKGCVERAGEGYNAGFFPEIGGRRMNCRRDGAGGREDA